MKRNAGAVTVDDVAAHAGVSIKTVSRVLNYEPNISEKTRAKVVEAMQTLDYRPNPAARTLRKGTSQIVGFVSDEVTITRYASAMIRGALDVAQQHEHTVLITETGTEPKRRDRAVRAMLDQRPDGLVFALMRARQIDLPAVPASVPIVILNGLSSTDQPCVLPAEFAAGSQVAETLLDAGHQRIGLIGFPPAGVDDPRVSATISDRLAGIQAVLAGAGLALTAEATVLDWEPEKGYSATAQILAEHDDLTALICMNDRLAFGAYQALQERGLRIPGDISVISFDDDEIASYLRPQLTTARIPYEQMGREAMSMLLTRSTLRQAQDAAGPPVRRVTMPMQLRGSVGTPVR